VVIITVKQRKMPLLKKNKINKYIMNKNINSSQLGYYLAGLIEGDGNI
jgi:hypothetical protein